MPSADSKTRHALLLSQSLHAVQDIGNSRVRSSMTHEPNVGAAQFRLSVSAVSRKGRLSQGSEVKDSLGGRAYYVPISSCAVLQYMLVSKGCMLDCWLCSSAC